MSVFPPPAYEGVLSFGTAVDAHWEHEGKKKGGVTGVNNMNFDTKQCGEGQKKSQVRL